MSGPDHPVEDFVVKLRRTENVGQVAVVRRVEERESDARDPRRRPPTWEQPAVSVELEHRCPVCQTLCTVVDQGAPACPAEAKSPDLHRRAADLTVRVRSERSRPMAQILTSQLQSLITRLQAQAH